MSLSILFTGASSMTGAWFAARLAEEGHAVHATFTKASPEEYTGLRADRVARCSPHVTPHYGCRFGDDRFLQLMRSESINLICCHGADVTNYKSPEFNPIQAVSTNCNRLPEVLNAAQHAATVVLTGSVFEGGEGAGSDGLRHVSPYGMSKAITWEMFRFYAEREGVGLGKFVVPNPFGPWEEPRFTSYLMRTWLAREAAQVRTPNYVRDNIPVSLLARAYARFVERCAGATAPLRFNPSQYVESQGAFAERVAREMRSRLNLPCDIQLANQHDFQEPRVRVNTDALDHAGLGWDEAAAWDEFAEYYARTCDPAAAAG